MTIDDIIKVLLGLLLIKVGKNADTPAIAGTEAAIWVFVAVGVALLGYFGFWAYKKLTR